MGAPPPWTPVLPTIVGLGFASVLSPTRGGVVNAGYSLHLLVLWGDTPHTPCHGGSAPGPPLPTPVGLGFASVLPLSEAETKFSPFPAREGGQGVRSEGHITHTPWEGAQSPPPSV